MNENNFSKNFFFPRKKGLFCGKKILRKVVFIYRFWLPYKFWALLHIRFSRYSDFRNRPESSVLIGREGFWPISRELDFSRTCGFRRMMWNHHIFHFRQKKVQVNELDFRQKLKNLIFRHKNADYAKKKFFFQKSGRATVSNFSIPDSMQKTRTIQWWEVC